MTQPLIELSPADDAPVLHIAPANGFVPQTYQPMLASLAGDYRGVCLPPRALWQDAASPPPVSRANDWRLLADDLLAGLDQHNLAQVIAIGHSFGGVASLLAAINAPERFRALILLDPTILPVHILDHMTRVQSGDMPEGSPLSQMAQRRRNEFESKDAAFARFRSRSLFEQWSDDVLRLYVEHGLKADESGEFFRLTWDPAWEAFYFDTVYTGIWDDLPALRGLLPTLIVQGGTTDTYVDEAAQRVREILPDATHTRIEAHGHLFPQSAPRQTGELIRAWLKDTLTG